MPDSITRAPAHYVTSASGGNVYFHVDGELWTAPVNIDGTPAWDDAYGVDRSCLDEEGRQSVRDSEARLAVAVPTDMLTLYRQTGLL